MLWKLKKIKVSELLEQIKVINNKIIKFLI